MNGDGFDDIIIGADGADPNGSHGDNANDQPHRRPVGAAAAVVVDVTGGRHTAAGDRFVPGGALFGRRDEAAAAGGRGPVPAAAMLNSTKHDKALAVGRAGVPAARIGRGGGV